MLENYTAEQLEAALQERRAADAAKAEREAERLARSIGPWPKYLDVYVHNEKWDENVTEWVDEETNWPEGAAQRTELAYIAYEVKLTYSVDEDGSHGLVAVDGVALSGDKWSAPE